MFELFLIPEFNYKFHSRSQELSCEEGCYLNSMTVDQNGLWDVLYIEGHMKIIGNTAVVQCFILVSPENSFCVRD